MSDGLHSFFDLITAIAYFSIPFSLIIFLKKRKLEEFKWVFFCFILFILFCGTTHLMHIIEYFYPLKDVHFLAGAIKAITAGVSMFTAILLWWIMPKALLIPSPSELEEANQILNRRTVEVHKINELLRQEIKEHKNTTDQLRYMTAIMQSSNDAIIGISLDETITSWNLGASEIFGYSSEEIVGHSYRKLLHSDHVNEMIQVLMNSRAGERLNHLEVKFVQKDGKIIEGSLTVSPVRSEQLENGIIGISIVIRDVTESKKLQIELRRLAELETISQIAASISHEVRNPLTVTRGFNQLLREHRHLTEEQINQYINLSLQELERAEHIINDYLTFAKPSLENIELLELNKELTYITQVINPYATMSNINVQILSENQDIHVFGDSKKLQQSLINIIKNGVEAMEQGGNLTVHLKKSKEKAIIRIEDTGKGMSPEQIKKLGTPYYSTKEKGTGLGTMVAFSIIKMMQGEIEIDSVIGKGTSFSISIPLVD